MTEPTSFLKKSLFDEYAPVEEAHLEEPMLLILMQSAIANNGPIGSFHMHEILSKTFEMSPADTESVRERGNSSLSRFRRTINNAYSHGTLVKKGWARETPDGLTITDNGCVRLTDLMRRKAIAFPPTDPMVSEHVERSFESNLKLRVLDCLDELQAGTKKRIPMTQLRLSVKSETVLSPADMETLKGRTDSKFDQIIRNLLISNNSLINEGMVTYKKGEGFAITKVGKVHLAISKVSCIPAPPFDLINQIHRESKAELGLARARIARSASSARKKSSESVTPPATAKKMKP